MIFLIKVSDFPTDNCFISEYPQDYGQLYEKGGKFYGILRYVGCSIRFTQIELKKQED